MLRGVEMSRSIFSVGRGMAFVVGNRERGTENSKAMANGNGDGVVRRSLFPIPNSRRYLSLLFPNYY
jgi:hypothetical protein